MSSARTISILNKIIMALREVEENNGKLPRFDSSEEDEQNPENFLDLVRQFNGKDIEQSEIEKAIDSISPLFPEFNFTWK